MEIRLRGQVTLQLQVSVSCHGDSDDDDNDVMTGQREELSHYG